MALVAFKRGLKPRDTSSLNPDTIHFFTDTKEIYLGPTPFSGSLEELIETVTQLETNYNQTKNEVSTLTSWKEAATEELSKKVANVAAADNSIVVDGTDTMPTLSVKLSEDGTITLGEDGLKAKDYTVKITKEIDSNSYKVEQEATGLNFTIDIPKDQFLKEGSVQVNPDDEHPGTFLVLLLNDDNNTKIYIDVKDLVDVVVSGSLADDAVQVKIDESKISASIKEGSIDKSMLSQDVQLILNSATEGVAALEWQEIEAV